MSDPASSRPLIIWATRGRHWGFKFLLDAGLKEPLHTYDHLFEGVSERASAFRREGTTAVLRFPDPEGRRDTAGRVIPHEFIVFNDATAVIDSAEAGQRVIWPLVAESYSRIWETKEPPSRDDIMAY